MSAMDNAPEAVPEELALFDLPPRDVAVEGVDVIEYKPVGQDGTNTSFIEFRVPQNNAYFIDLRSSTLQVTVKIVKEDGTPTTPEDKVSLANLPLHTMWSQADMTLGQQMISQGTNNHYAYKSYFDVLLFGGENAASLSAQGYHFETPGNMGMTDPTVRQGEVNNGVMNRWALTKDGNRVQFEGCPFIDMWRQIRYLPNGLEMGLKLWHSQDKFRLMAPEETSGCRLVVDDASLKLSMVKLTPRGLLGINKTMERKTLKYPYDRSDFKSYNIPAGQYDFSIDDVYNGAIPDKIVIAVVSSKSYAGSYVMSPYEFKHYDVNFLAFYKNGKSIPGAPLTPNYTTKEFLSAYLTLAPKEGDRPGVIEIRRGDYDRGYAIYELDLAAKKERNGLFTEQENGHTRFEMKFSKPLPEAATVLMYAKFPSMIQIDHVRNVIQ
jgi:hypothetical protein